MVKPCDDFYEYVCSETIRSFKLPEDRSSWYFSFSDNSERLLQAKKKFFSKLEAGFEPKSPRIRGVRNYYLACINEKTAAASEKRFVEKGLRQLTKIRSTAGYQKLVQDNSTGAEFSGLQVVNIPNIQDPAQGDILVIPSALTMPEKTYYQNAEAMKDLQALAKAFFETVKLDDPEGRAAKVVAFETTLAKDFPLPTEIRSLLSSNTYRSREDFLKNYPALGLDKVFGRLNGKTQVRDLAPAALLAFDRLLKNSDLVTLQSVFAFHSLGAAMDDAYPEFYAKTFEFNRKYGGGPAQRPARDERCTTLVMKSFAFEIDEYLTPILFPDFPRQKVVDLVARVRGTILENLDRNTWLSDQARAEAKNKMQNAGLFLVQPSKDSEWNFNPILGYDAKDKIGNVLKLESALKEKMFDELKSPRPRDRWGYGPLTLNAYYSPPDNHFVLLQGILQPPFFDPEQTEIENIGAIGAVVGHELGHGIDDNGSKYNAKGELANWMTVKDLEEFRKRGNMFVKRFNAVGHNGQLTLGENIGDHVGVTSAYDAAFRKNPKASVSDKQSFFKSYARLWCNVARPEVVSLQLKTDPHSLGRERTNQQVVHLDGFYEAYSCQRGDKMYVAPKQRIRVW